MSGGFSLRLRPHLVVLCAVGAALILRHHLVKYLHTPEIEVDSVRGKLDVDFGFPLLVDVRAPLHHLINETKRFFCRQEVNETRLLQPKMF